jgi:hypothetical protein
MAAGYNLIRFNSHKNITIIEIWENKIKDQTRTQDVTEFGFKNAYVSETLNLQQLRLSRNTKNSFTLVELGPLHKNGLSSLSVTRVTTHSKRMSDNTLKNKKWVTTHSKRWALHLKKGVSTTAQENIFKKTTKDQVGRIERC